VLVCCTRARGARARAIERAIDFHRRALARIDERGRARHVGRALSRRASSLRRRPRPLRRGSLFELLCTCRTRRARTGSRRGSRTGGTDEIRERQAAAAELGGALDLREDLSLLGDDARSELDRDRIVAWATRPIQLGVAARARARSALGVAAAAALVAWMSARSRAARVT
jgi:hypothetical protein